ncbi:NADH-dependent butanol dehydrogenase A [Enterococcus moraviensis ATCC BAA-383]|uniref:NADH-dependent butanol dehydrogenase A n=1 Tax=Enterococcus moraviensis ATCC BAA-383 TaxID=1158609 RepID=R2T8K4_9ENTE|nr:iron-containing alcohol dehydrogenase [Enterococcus moraviensis]EOH96559.1 NADH-dependent butanol dehydrogenase A [Enterococcus moraviensis ATCC BAA-383]EOT65985.1 NADH-dependent butanol dehydrogenase A [Enterococcus moraviensis ATCC BAA-383]
MDNFRFYVPTDIRFGKDRLATELTDVLDVYGKKVLIVYGGGSIKKNGLYDQVIDLLEKNQNKVVELSGVEPNPRIETVRRGVSLCRENDIDVILAVGGGSTIDCAKVVAAGFYSEEDPWDIIVARKGYQGEALPIVTILTLAATGSEMNAGAVISNLESNQKLGVGGPSMIPKVSFLDPTNTFTVPAYQTAAGSADILSHLFESYFNITEGTDVQDFVSEGLMRAVIKNCPIALETPEDYDARANLMWSSSLALNGLTRNGKHGVWSCHAMEHELSAFYDITHGIGLAILTPRWMDYVLNEKTVTKFAQFAHNVWGINEKDPMHAAKKGIQATYDFFKSCGIPMTLPEVGIEKDKFAEMAKQAVAHSTIKIDAFVPLAESDVEAIYHACLTESSFVY